MLKKHITDILHSHEALDLIDQYATLMQRHAEIRYIMNWGSFEDRGQVLKEYGQIVMELPKIIELIEERYHVVKRMPHPKKLKDAWQFFRYNGDKEAFLTVLRNAEKLSLKQK